MSVEGGRGLRRTAAQQRSATPAELVSQVCPYLVAPDGRWRRAVPAREHRCTAVSPPAFLAPDKQRRLCLSADHVTCATFLAAVGSDPDTLPPLGPAAAAGSRATRWGYARTAPLITEPARFGPVSAAGLRARQAGQFALAAALLVALVAVVLPRLSGTGGDVTAVVSATPSASPAPTTTTAPTTPRPSPTPTEAPAPPTESAPPSTLPSGGATEYTVVSGDTLYGIAQRFGTTVEAIQEINGLGNSTGIRAGQVLAIPERESS